MADQLSGSESACIIGVFAARALLHRTISDAQPATEHADDDSATAVPFSRMNAIAWSPYQTARSPSDEIPDAAADGDRRDESRGADADDAGQQHEDLERRRRRQDRRDQHRHDAVPLERGERPLDCARL